MEKAIRIGLILQDLKNIDLKNLKQGPKEHITNAISELEKIKLFTSTTPLIVIDLNGVLVDREYIKGCVENRPENLYEGYRHIGQFAMWKRKGIDELFDFLFENYDVAIWSSVKSYNLKQILDFLNIKGKLLFTWCQDQCDAYKSEVTPGGFIFKKDIEKIHQMYPEYPISSILLIDNTPEKCVNLDRYYQAKTWSRDQPDVDCKEIIDAIRNGNYFGTTEGQSIVDLDM